MKSTPALLVLPLALPLLRAPLAAQDPTPTNEQKYEAKLVKEFATAVPWLRDVGTAMVASRRSGKLVFAYFTRSYAP